MSDRQALLGEAAVELRQLMYGSLTSVGYRLVDVGTVSDLVRGLHRPDFLTAETALLVLNSQWTQACALPLAVAASQRWQLQLPRLKLVLVYEWGTLGAIAQPPLEHCELIGVLEKPFALGELEQIAALALARVA